MPSHGEQVASLSQLKHGQAQSVVLSSGNEILLVRVAEQVFAIQGRWFPDAFGGSMGELMRAVTEGREPQTSGRDNLNSVRIAFAGVQSSQTGQVVELT